MPEPTNDNATSNVVEFTGNSRLPIPVSKVLELAGKQDLDDVIVIGQRPDGRYYVTSSTTDVFYLNWIIDIVKKNLLAGDPFDEGAFDLVDGPKRD